MREYCITFGNDDGGEETEIYHCHVTAPTDGIAISAAFEGAMQQNVSLQGSTMVSAKTIVDIPEDMLAGYEALRLLRHIGGVAPTQEAAPNPTPLH